MSFPDVTGLLVAHFATLLSPLPVSVDVPATRPDEFVQIRRIGGPALPPVRDLPRLDFIAWSTTAIKAMTLLTTVRTELWALAGTTTIGVTVYRVDEELGPRQANDPDTGLPMATMTMQLNARADAAIQFTQ